MLSNKVTSSFVGLWFLVAEHMRLGSWDLIKGYTGGNDNDFNPRIAMQLVNEAALCKNRMRQRNQITNQGFELLNGMRVLVTDEQVHNLLSAHTVAQAKDFQENLAKIRLINGHYKGEVIAMDPHRIITSSKRIMPKKKKQPKKPSEKMLQTFFSLDAQTGQPIVFSMGSSAEKTINATLKLIDSTKVVSDNAIILADKEHYNEELFRKISNGKTFELLVPAISTDKIRKIEKSLTYQFMWSGYYIAETEINFAGSAEKYRLIVQREGERPEDYSYKSFLTISKKPGVELLTERYGERWSIEEFFKSEGAMGFDRASTFNLNVRYGKMSLALLAQAAVYQFRQKLPLPYQNWNALHLSDAIFRGMDGDIRVVDDTIVITCYNAPKEYQLQKHYQNLPKKIAAEGINPKIPWLFDFKLDFRFK